MKRNLKISNHKGLQVFCQKCRRTLSPKFANNGCDHPFERQTYKASIIVPDSGGIRKTRNLKSINHDDALIELLQFKKEIEHPELFKEEIEEKPGSLLSCIEMYLDYMNDEDVPHHKKKYLDSKYINSTRTELQDFLLFIKNKVDKDFGNFKIEKINDKIVGKYCEYVEAKNQKNYTYNSRIKTLRSLFNYLITKKQYDLINVWKDVRLKPTKPTNISIYRDDFFDLIGVSYKIWGFLLI